MAEKYRGPIMLCYLERKSYEQAARELGCPKSSLESRLRKALELLRRTLDRRGITLGVGALATALAETAKAAPLPAALTIKTVKAAASWLRKKQWYAVVSRHTSLRWRRKQCGGCFGLRQRSCS